MDRPHPLHRIGDVGAHREHQVVDVVATEVPSPRAGGDGDAGHQTPPGEVTLAGEVPAEGSSADGEEHVVQRHRRRPLRRQELVQRHRRHGEGAVGVERRVERGARGRERHREIEVGRLGGLPGGESPVDAGPDEPGEIAGPLGAVAQGLDDEIAVGGKGLRMGRFDEGLVVDGEGVLQEGHGGTSVGERVVQLHHEGHTAVLEAVDHGELPEGTIPGELDRGDVGDHRGQLTVAAG